MSEGLYLGTSCRFAFETYPQYGACSGIAKDGKRRIYPDIIGALDQQEQQKHIHQPYEETCQDGIGKLLNTLIVPGYIEDHIQDVYGIDPIEHTAPAHCQQNKDNIENEHNDRGQRSD